MLKSCSYCGKIHDKKYECPSKPRREKYKVTEVDRFRWTKAWQRKRKEINERDKYMCQVCIRKLYNTHLQYNYTDIEVHHITPLAEDYSLKLDAYNLICLCAYHHKMAECGEIPKAELFKIAEEQEEKNNY